MCWAVKVFSWIMKLRAVWFRLNTQCGLHTLSHSVRCESQSVISQRNSQRSLIDNLQTIFLCQVLLLLIWGVACNHASQKKENCSLIPIIYTCGISTSASKDLTINFKTGVLKIQAANLISWSRNLKSEFEKVKLKHNKNLNLGLIDLERIFIFYFFDVLLL